MSRSASAIESEKSYLMVVSECLENTKQLSESSCMVARWDQPPLQRDGPINHNKIDLSSFFLDLGCNQSKDPFFCKDLGSCICLRVKRAMPPARVTTMVETALNESWARFTALYLVLVLVLY